MRFAVNAVDVCSEEIDGEVIIINLTTGSYYSLGGSGATVWRMALSGWTAAEIAAHFERVVTEPSAVEAEVAKFLDFLTAENVLRVSPEATCREVPGLAPADSFAAPVVEKFTDMQELMLVDPIHEVAESGWPLRDTGGS